MTLRSKPWRSSQALLCATLSLSLGACSELTPQSGAGALERAGTFKSLKSCGESSPHYFTYLDDTGCRKRVPLDQDRGFMCPTSLSTDSLAALNEQLPTPYAAATEPVEVDVTTLKGVVPDDLSIALILVKRVNGVPYYRYLSNGSHDKVLEPWSSSKFLAVINAASSLRYHSEGALGLDAMAGELPLGDLVSALHSYDEERYTSNSLSAWFHDIGGRAFANGIIHERWLKRPVEERFGANYGDRSADIPYKFKLGDKEIEIDKDQAWYPSNALSTFTLAEALKRLVMHREDRVTRLEEITWEDVEVLLYGAPQSLWYGPEDAQGMQGDSAVYLQESVSAERREQVAQGKWRVYSKLGLGASRGGEFVYTGYACFPNLDEAGSPLEGEGVELIIATHWGAQGDYHARDEAQMDLYRDLVSAIDRGALQ